MFSSSFGTSAVKMTKNFSITEVQTGQLCAVEQITQKVLQNLSSWQKEEMWSEVFKGQASIGKLQKELNKTKVSDAI